MIRLGTSWNPGIFNETRSHASKLADVHLHSTVHAGPARPRRTAMPRCRLFLRCAKPIAVMVVTVALSYSGEIKAEPLDRLVEEGVQILKEKHEIVHLQITRQL